MEAPESPPGRRTLTPAVLLAAIFTTVCALASVAFVAGRGGLDLPLAASTAPAVAVQSGGPVSPRPTPLPTASPGPAPSAVPAPSASGSPTSTPGPVGTPDPLTALPACPGHPRCYLYSVRRGDTLSTIGDRWRIPVTTIEALNPQLTDPRTIVVGETLYLGRSPFVRLAACDAFPGCYLYVVQPGDRLSMIAARFDTTVTAILATNPGITDPNAIYSGQALRLSGPY